MNNSQMNLPRTDVRGIFFFSRLWRVRLRRSELHPHSYEWGFKFGKIKKLLLMGLLHFIVMYFLMYAMVNSIENIFLNINNFYMAGIMTTPMLIIEILLMGSMYQNKTLTGIIGVVSVAVFITLYLFIRQQTGVKDEQFLKSMIPHHSGAILMCERASIENNEIKELCGEIIESQQEEINQMKNILERF